MSNWLYDILRTGNSEYRKLHKFIDSTKQIFEAYNYHVYAASNDRTFAKIPHLGNVPRMAGGL